ncbi:hypothetical protein QSI02_24675, partial [Escherichia coli]|nr:hypothetical protein [Escherichia coli]
PMNIHALYPSRQFLDAKIRTWVDFMRADVPALIEADEAALAALPAAAALRDFLCGATFVNVWGAASLLLSYPLG